MSRNYNKLWPEQAKAKWLVQAHVKRGKIIKPDCCELCGKPFPPAKLQAHHHDYASPLKVSWYCSTCHKEVHRTLGTDWKENPQFEVTQIISLSLGDEEQ